jgi:hypothetical protein
VRVCHIVKGQKLFSFKIILKQIQKIKNWQIVKLNAKLYIGRMTGIKYQHTTFFQEIKNSNYFECARFCSVVICFSIKPESYIVSYDCDRAGKKYSPFHQIFYVVATWNMWRRHQMETKCEPISFILLILVILLHSSQIEQVKRLTQFNTHAHT